MSQVILFCFQAIVCAYFGYVWGYATEFAWDTFIVYWLPESINKNLERALKAFFVCISVVIFFTIILWSINNHMLTCGKAV